MQSSSLGARLKQARKKIELTQKVVCEKLSIQNTQSLSAYENGTQMPSLETLEKLISLYHVSADWLLFGKSPEYSSNKARLIELLSLLDQLDMAVEAEEGFGGGHTGRYIIDLSHASHSGYLPLFDAVYKYKALLAEGNLSAADYSLLLKNRIDSIAGESNDFEPAEPPPFLNVEDQVEQWVSNYEPI